GADLLDSVPPQKYLQRLLALPSVEYFHVPVVVNREGQKLSKQTGAVGVDVATPAAASRTAIEVLRRLGAAPPDEARGARPAELWAWAAGNWRIESLRGIGPLPAGA